MLNISFLRTLVIEGFIFIAALMFLFWLVSVMRKNAGIVDIGWALCLVFLASFYAVTGKGFLLRSGLIMLMVMIWGLRLVTLLVFRIFQDKHEDRRYKKLRADWQPHVEWKFLALFEAEAILALILAIPFLLIAINPYPHLHAIEILGIIIWVIGFIGEVIADEQLKDFKSQPAHQGKTCDSGFWYYSRHPNYFFEWLMWVGYFIFALGSPWGWIAVISPVIMYHFLINVTGVPLAEEQALRNRGEEYRRYQKSTSMFFPLPKRKVL